VYSAKIDGKPTTFGTSGMLYRSNKLMYHRTTETLWSQFTGVPVIGPLADSGIRLGLFPSEQTTWSKWRARHPDTTVLSLDTGVYLASQYPPESDPTTIYYNYFNSPGTMFPVFQQSARLALKDIVLGIEIGGVSTAYPIALLQAARVINDGVGETAVVVLGSAESQAARAYERGAREFSLDASRDGTSGLPATLTDATGARWTVTEGAIVSANGTRLARIPAITSFWHGWFSFHAQTGVYEGVAR
jgi:hypothetical protein